MSCLRRLFMIVGAICALQGVALCESKPVELRWNELSGMVAGHNVDTIKWAADNLEVDFFMTCFYFLTRKKSDNASDPTVATLEVSYPFYKEDPLAMARVIRSESRR